MEPTPDSVFLKDTETQIESFVSVPTGEDLNLESAIKSALPDFDEISPNTGCICDRRSDSR